MLYNHLSHKERNIIEHSYFVLKKSILEIANDLKRNRSTIYRELKRNTRNGEYNSHVAMRMYTKRRNHKNLFLYKKYKSFIDLFNKYHDKRSHGIEATIHKIKTNHPIIKRVSVKQVYNWINKGYCNFTKSYYKLRTKYIKGSKRTKGHYSKFDGKYVFPLWARPKRILLREEFGHWEVDLVIGKKAKGYHNLLTLVERKTRIVFVTRVKSRYPHAINKAIKDLKEKYNLNIKTITIDNGLEFQKIGILCYWINCKAYYCEPYASFQRGTNENANGLIRRWYKKGFDFTLLTDNEIQNLQNKINNIPRKKFNFLSSYQVYRKCCEK